MPRYKLTLEYDGTRFHGWQRQGGGLSTVQAAIEEALAQITGTAALVEGAGRTDTGVHATGQVAHCDLVKDFRPDRLRDALNFFIVPQGASVIRAESAPDSFHARFDAIRRCYTYRILNRRAPGPLEAHRVWHVIQPLDISLMQKAAQQLIGHYDFTSFRDSRCQAASPFKTLEYFEIRQEGEHIIANLQARSFLHHQVRIMMGTLVYVGLRKWPVSKMREILAACDRRAAGLTAPAHGLYLTGVAYE